MSSQPHLFPLGAASERILAGRRHVTLGISPFNGYYTQERITALTAWAADTFDAVSFFVPDASPAHTFRALGYTPDKARQKARKQAKCVLNRIRTAIDTVGLPGGDALVAWSEPLATNPRYLDLAVTVRAAFEVDADLRDAVLDASSWVLAGALPAGTEPTPEQRRTAAEYLLDEMPLFLDSAGIVGAPESLFVYHQRVRLLERLFAGELGLRPEPHQGFLVVADEPVHAVV